MLNLIATVIQDNNLIDSFKHDMTLNIDNIIPNKDI